MQDTEFAIEASRIINLIAELIEQQDPDGNIDIDINSDILNLTTNEGIFVINKQSGAKEIWLSSPISGPHHFYNQDGNWISRNQNELFSLLGKELKLEIKDNKSSG